MEKLRYMDVPMIANDPVFRKLAQISDYSAMSAEDQKKYERSIKVMRDNYATYLGAIQEGIEKGQTIGFAKGHAEGIAAGIAEGRAVGIAEGREEGRKEGCEEGREEGRKEGREEGILSTAKNMKAKGLATDLIMEVTGLSQQEVDRA